MSENKFRLLAKCLAAVLIPCLLAATVYYASLINLNVVPEPAFGFTFIQGAAGPTSVLPQNWTMYGYGLGLALVLQNRTEVHINDMLWDVHNAPRGVPLNDGFDVPEFNGTIETGSLPASMSVMLQNYMSIVGNESDESMFMGGPTPISGGVYYKLSSSINTTLSTVLATSTKTFDMGSYSWQGGSASNPGSIGYWLNASHFITNAPSWSINSTDLSSFLQGSNNVSIEFHAAFSVHVNYTFYYPDNTSKAGVTDSHWNGTMGTFSIRRSDAGTYEVQYDWTRIIFAVVPVNN